MALASGDRVGRYVVEERIADGARGSVYRAAREGGGRSVALKVLRSETSGDVAPLVASTRSAAALDHPNIAAIIEVGTHDGALFVARELVRGTTIVNHAKSASRADRIRGLIAVAGALHFAHTRGVVHGAVREGNVLVEKDGTLKVTDFAIGDAHDAASDRRGWIDLANAILHETDFSASIRDALQAAAGENGSLDRAASMLEGAIDEPSGETVTPDVSVAPDVAASSPKAAAPAGTLRTASRDPFDARRFALIAVIIACSIVVLYATRRKPSPPARGTSDAGAPIASMSATQGAPSPSPQAVALFNGAMQSMRDASIDQARATLDEVLKIDPGYASAHLRRALLSIVIDDTSREHFGRAMSLRAALTSHERVLLEAFEPVMRGKPVFPTCVQRMEAAVASEPQDADFAFHLGNAHWLAGQLSAAVEAMDRALALDPQLALASRARAYLLVALNETTKAISEYERCLLLSPGATRCLYGLADVQLIEGDCTGAEQTSRRTIALEPSSANAYYVLAAALCGQGKDDAARIAADEYVRRLPEGSREIRKLAIEQQWAVLRGDFLEAERALDAWDEAIAASPGEWKHYAPTERRMELYMETGRSPRAVEVGKAFLAQQSALRQESNVANARLLVLGAMHRASGGSAAMLDQERVKARGLLDVSGTSFESMTASQQGWLSAYATSIANSAEAQAALTSLKHYPPLPAEGTRSPVEVDGMVGRVLWLAGKHEEALAPLRRSARSCFAFTAPLFHTQLLALLADAERGAGNTNEACSHYSEVLRRWGSSRPVSRTALAAKAAHASLQCGN